MSKPKHNQWVSRLLQGTVRIMFAVILAAGSAGLEPATSQPVQAMSSQTLVLSWWARTFSYTNSLAWGDADGDGDLDLAVGNTTGANQLYWNNGSGEFTLDNTWAPGDQGTNSLAWGDADGDGDLDLAVGNLYQPSQLFRNDGGVLTQTGWTPPSMEYTEKLVWGDADGDYDLDLFVANMFGSSRLYLNDGLGGLAESATFQTAKGLALGDADGDGDLDMVLVGSINGVHLYVNDGAGNYYQNPNWAPDLIYDQSAAWGVVDNDGDLDLIVGLIYGQNVLFINDGMGGLVQDTSFVPAILNTQNVFWVDANGDGDLDLSVVAQHEILLYQNDGKGQLTLDPAWTLVINVTQKNIAWADANGDGDLDMMVGYYGGFLQFYRNDGAGAWGQAAPWQPAYIGTTSLAWGDVDGDGDLDLAVGNDFTDQQSNTYPNQLYRNNGYGSLTLDPNWLPEARHTNSLAWGDVDGDGDLDLAVGNAAQANQLFRNDGAGGLTLVDTWTPPVESTIALAWGDVDGDGDLDLAVANGGSASRLYLNDGSGSLSSVPVWDSHMASAASLAWGDVDGDGDLDLALGGMYLPNELYLNDGAGTLVQDTSWKPVSNETRSLAWGDVDGDGDLDLAAGNGSGPADPASSSQLYRNDGAGQLTWDSNWIPEARASEGIAWADVDGDGDLDLVLANASGKPNQLYRNQSGNLVYDSTWSDDQMGSYALALGDADGDGDLDVAAATNNGVRLFLGGRNPAAQANSIPVVSLPGIDPLENVNFSAADPAIRTTPVAIPYALFDPEGDPVREVRAFFSLDGGGTWRPASQYEGSVKPKQIKSNQLLNQATFQGMSLRMNGAYAGLQVPGSAGLAPASFTIEAWIKADRWGADSSSGTIMSTQDGAGAGFALSVGAGGQLAFTNSCHLTGAVSDALMRPGTWYHVAGSWDAPSLTLTALINGQAVKTVTCESTPAASSADFTFGYSAQNGRYFDGAIDEIRLWDSARTPNQIQADYQAALIGNESGLTGYWPLDQLGQGTTPDQTAFNHPADTIGGVISAAGALKKQGVYQWDAFADGVFGRSDNVIVRLVAFPSVAAVSGISPTLYQRPYQAPVFRQVFSSAQTAPFRLRGKQVRVLMQNGTPASGARVYRVPASLASGGQPITNASGAPYVTDSLGYLQGSVVLDAGERLAALYPLPSIAGSGCEGQRCVLYYTSLDPAQANQGLQAIDSNPVQTLTVSDQHPLQLFNLVVSLQWDARGDDTFLADLNTAFRQASNVLYDVTDGQVALGTVQVYQNREHWLDADIVIYAQNSIRPRATMGGVVEKEVDDTGYDALGAPKAIQSAYTPGQIRMGPNWDPFGSNLAELKLDWQRALAHELSHYLLFLPDNYIGIDNNLPVTTDCQGSFMTSTYDSAYSEFLTGSGWLGDCLKTMAQYTTKRTDWETITRFYPALQPPAVTIAGPDEVPLDVLAMKTYAPAGTAQALPGVYFDVRNSSGALQSVPGGQVYLFKTQDLAVLSDDAIIYLGETVGAGDRIKVRGASVGDRVCLYGPYNQTETFYWWGCKTITGPADRSIIVGKNLGWNPAVRIEALEPVVETDPLGGTVIRSRFGVRVDLPKPMGDFVGLSVQIFPAYGDAMGNPPVATTALLDTADRQHFYKEIVLDSPVYEGSARIFLHALGSDVSLADTISTFFLSPPWGPNQKGPFMGGNIRGYGANNRALGAPVASGDGQVSIFNFSDIFADTGTVALQAMPGGSLPNLPQWLKAVGQGYRFTPDTYFPRVISFDYLQRDVPPGYEHTLNIYYLAEGAGGATWVRLNTRLNKETNQATAVMPESKIAGSNPPVTDPQSGRGVYALVATVDMPALNQGWNLFGYPLPGSRPIEIALASVWDAVSLVVHQDPVTQTWHYYDPQVALSDPTYAGLVNDLPQLEFGKVYWINATQAVTPFLGVPEPGDLLLSPVLSAPSSDPGAPALFYGPIDGAQVGMSMQAKIGSTVCGQTQIVEWAGGTAYRLLVDTSIAGCSSSAGQAIRIEVNGELRGYLPVENSDTASIPLDMGSVYYPHQLYLPNVIR